MKKIYVGNLAYNTTSENLSEIFSKFGEIKSANVIKDKYTGSSKGFAFVEMAESQAADEAIQKLDGSDVDGRNIKVKEATENPARGQMQQRSTFPRSR